MSARDTPNAAPPVPEDSPDTAASHAERGADDERTRLAAVAALGRLVGVDLADRVTFDGVARAHGARGLVHDGRMHLDPGWRDDATGRRVALHEALHLRQASLLPGAPGIADVRDDRRRRHAAEREADRATATVLAGHAPPAMHVPLAAGDVAHDDGADRLADLRLSEEAVDSTHRALRQIVHHLVGEDDLADRDVDAAVATLDEQPLNVGAGAVATLDPADQGRLVQALDDDHRQARRHGVLAVLLGLEPTQLARLDTDDVATLNLSGLEPDEHTAAVEVLRNLRHEVLRTLLEDAPNRVAIRRLMEEPVPGPPAEPPTTVEGVVGLVREDVRTVSRAGSVRALGRLTRFVTAAARATSRTDAGGEETGATPPPAASPLEQAATAMATDGTLTRLIDGIGEERAGLSRDAVAVLDTLTALHVPPDPGELRDVAERARALLSRSFTDWAVTDSDAEQALPLVLRIARANGRLLRQLDAEGKVDTLFDELPDAVLYRADVRGQTGEIMAARREEVLVERAREKLSRSFFDWAVTARDAYLASRMYTAMSPRAQQAFAELEGGVLLERMNDEMTTSMRQAPDRHGLSPGAASVHREQARTLLADPATWTGDWVETLRTLVLVAVTTGLGQWVFDRSAAYQAYRDEDVRQRVVTPFRLYDPTVGRHEFAPSRLEGTGFFQEGIFEGARAFAGGPGWLYGVVLGLSMLDGVEVQRDATRGTQLVVSLEELAREMGGGDLYGARFRTAEQAVEEEAAAERAGGPGPPARVPGTNNVTITHERPGDDGQGRLGVTAPAIELASYRSVSPDGLLAFGRLRATDLEVAVAYTTGEQLRPTSLAIDAAGLDIDDLVRGAADSLAAAASLSTGRLVLRGGTGQIPEQVGEATNRERGFWHWLAPLLDEAFALLDLTDTWEAQASAVSALEIDLGDLVVTGLLVGGQRIERVTATDLHIGYGSDQLSYLRVLERSLLRRRERAAGDGRAVAAIDARLEEVRGQIRAREETEDERQRLEDQFQREPTAMAPEARARLRELRGSGGSLIDAAGVTVAGLAGAAEVGGELRLTGISGEAAFRGRAPAVATEAARVQEFLDTGPPGQHDLDRPHVRLHIDRAAFSDLTLPGDVPDADELRRAIAELDDQLGGAEGPTRQALLDRRAALQQALDTDLPAYTELERRAAATRWGTGGPRPTGAETPLRPDEQRERARLRASLRLLTSTTVRSGQLEHLEVGADLAGTVTEVGAQALELQQVERGGTSVERVTGTDVEARVHTERAGYEGLIGLPDTLTRAEVEASSLGVTGVRSNGERLVEDVALTGVAADVRPFEGGWDIAALHLDTLAVTGLRLVSSDRVITTFPDDPALSAAPADRPAVAEPTGGGTVELGDVDMSAQVRTDERGELTGVTVRSLVIGALRMPDPVRYLDGERDLTLSADQVTGIEVHGLEVPLADDTVPLPTAGTLRVRELDQLRVAGRFTAALRAGFTLDGPPPSGATLQLTFTEDEVELGHLDLPALDVADLVFDDGTRRIEVGGPARLRGITARARVGLVRGTDEEGAGTVEPGAIQLHELHVRRITAPHMRFEQGATVLEAAGGYDVTVPTIEDLNVRGLRLGADLSFRGADVHVRRARLGLAGDFTASMTGGVEADVNHLDLRLGAGFEQVTGSLGPSRLRGGVALDDGTVVGGDISGLAVGSFGWDAATRTLRFGDTGPEGVVDGITVERLEVGPVELATPELEVELGTTGVGAATLRGVRVAAAVTFEEGPGGSVDWEHFRAELGEVHADGLDVEGLTLRLPASGVELTFPSGMTATAGPIDIVPNGSEPLVIERTWTTGRSATSFQGRLEVARAVVPELRVGVGRWLTAGTRLELDDLELGVLSSGTVELHLRQLRALGTDLAADLRAHGIGVIPTRPPAGGYPGFDLNALFAQVHAALTPWADVLEHADGHLRAQLTLPFLPSAWQHEQLDLTIRDGAIDLHRLEDTLGRTGDLLFDFEFTSPGLVLELDASDVLLGAAPAVGATPSPWALLANVDLLRWNLDSGDAETVERTQLLPIIDVFRGRAPGWLNTEIRTRTAGSPPTSDPAAFRLSNIDLALDVRTPHDIPVSIPPFAGPAGSHVDRLDTVVPRNTLTGLRATGSLPGPAGLVRLRLARLALGRTELEASNVAGGDVVAAIDDITVRGARGELGFRGSRGGIGGQALPPTEVSADLDELVANGIDVRWIPGRGGTP